MKKSFLLFFSLLSLFSFSIMPSYGITEKKQSHENSFLEIVQPDNTVAQKDRQADQRGENSLLIYPGSKASAEAKAASTVNNIKGTLIEDYAENNKLLPGLYLLQSTPHNLFYDYDHLVAGSFFNDGKIYSPCIFWSSVSAYSILYIIDSYTGELLSEKRIDSKLEIHTSTYSPTLAAGIGCAAEVWSDDYKLVSFTKDGELTVLKDLSQEHHFDGGMTTGPDGTVYGMTEDGRLYSINTDDFSFELIGETGIISTNFSPLAFDAKNNLIYSTPVKRGTKTALYSIDPKTADAEKIYDFDGTYMFGVIYIESSISEEAPGTVSDVQIKFNNGSYTGEISFIPPTTTGNGVAATGNINYRILINGQEAASGTTTYGASRVTETVTITQDGYHDISIVCSNDKGDGESVSNHVYLGHDTPTAVTELTLTRNESTMALSWKAPTSVHGGYINVSEVKYDIARIVNGKETIVATDNSSTSYTDTYSKTDGVDMEAVKYSVKAKYKNHVSPASISNKTILGSMGLPYKETFETDNMFDFYTIVDHNEDNFSWKIDTETTSAICSNNVNKTPDDYLFLPPVSLKKDKIYTISFLAGCRMEYYPEEVALYVGTQPEVSALTETLVMPTKVTTQYDHITKAGQEFSVEFIPTKDEIYYFAIRSCSKAYNFVLHVTDLTISAPVSSEAPSAVSDLTVTADKTGKASVEISFKAPTISINDTPLTSLDKIEIYRGETLIKTINAPTPGASIKETDSKPEMGEVKYSVVAYNAEGKGITRSATVFVGLDQPIKPENLTFSTGADNGEVKLTWDAVSKDINGKELTGVTYLVYRLVNGEWDLIEDGITATSYTIRESEADAKQKFVQYAVEAQNSVGISDKSITPLSCIGKPDSTPYIESATIDHIIGFLREKGSGQWSIAHDGDLQNLTSYNGDKAFFKFTVQKPDEMASIITGKIHADLKVPVLTFYYYCFGGMDYNTIQISVNDGKEIKKVGDPIVLNEGVPYQWNRASVYLTDYAGKDIQVILTATGVNFGVSYIDHIMLDDAKGRDLGISVSTQQEVECGHTLPIDVTVFNYGYEDQTDFSVELIVNDEIYETKEGEPLAGGQTAIYRFEYPISPVKDTNLAVKAYVDCVTDDDMENNMSETFNITVKYPYYPAVKDLKGNINSTTNHVELSWGQPNYSDFTIESTEDFESLESFATIYTGDKGDWTLADLDRGLVGRFTESNIPNVQYMTVQSFFVLDSSHEVFNKTFASHSGHKHLAALYNYDESPNDDWVISPELNGYAQKITFYARAYAPSYPEVLEVHYSTTDNKPKSFTSVTKFSGITTDNNFGWTKYEFEIPEGAKYFAINYVNAGGFMVFVDDVTFAAKNGTPIQLVGYNVYRDGEKINNEVITSTTFDDPEGKGSQIYNITVVYDKGESGPSNAIRPDGKGVNIDYNTDNTIEVIGGEGEIIVKGAKQVLISDVQGRVLHIGTSTTIYTEPGFYIVRADGNTYKVSVR